MVVQSKDIKEIAVQKELVKPKSAGMNKWLVVFCWIVIFAGLYPIYKTFEFGFANPVSEAFVDSWQGQAIRYFASLGVIALGAIFGRFKGFAVALALVAIAHVALVIFHV